MLRKLPIKADNLAHRLNLIPMRILILVQIITLVFGACTLRTSPEWFDSQLKDIQQEIFEKRGEAWKTDTVLTQEAIALGDRFLERYPNDSIRVPMFRYELVKWHTEIGNFDAAIVHIDRIRADYPNHPIAPAVLHFKAYYIYDQGLNDMDKARDTYMQFLDEYPDHNELVEAVLFSLEHLGRSDEDILNELLEKKAAEGAPDEETP